MLLGEARTPPVRLVVDEFERMPRSGDTVYGFAIGIYPTGHPRLPTPE